MKANYHTHSCFCDGKDTPADVAAWAFAHGFTHLGFSGHMDQEIHMDVDAYYREIRSLQEMYRGRMDILRGIEIDTLYATDCLYDAEYTIGSTHYLDIVSDTNCAVDYTPETMQKICHECFADDYYALAKAYYELEAQVYDRTGCTIIGHFDLVTRFNDEMRFLDENDRRYRSCALEAMTYLVSKGVPFEINCGAVNRGRKKEFYPSMSLLRALHDLGGEIFINSDAHQKELLSGAFDQAVAAAKACGFTHTCILEHKAAGSDAVIAPAGSEVIIRKIPLDSFTC